MASWADPSDYWFNRVPPNQSPLPAMQLGAQIVRQRAIEVMREKELELETQRTMISVQDAISKRELQNKIMAGDAELAKSMSGVTNWADPAVMENLWKIGETHPVLMGTPQWTGAMKLHENAVIARDRLREAEASRAARTEAMARRLDLMAEHYGNQDEIGRLRQEAVEANRIQNQEYRQQRLDQIDRQMERLEEGARYQRERFEWEKGRMTPERRALFDNKWGSLENDLKALEGESFRGQTRDPKTGKLSADAYQQRRSEIKAKQAALESEFFGQPVSGGQGVTPPLSPIGAPLNTTLKKPITPEIAREFLDKSGGDKEKARAMAREAGYEF